MKYENTIVNNSYLTMNIVFAEPIGLSQNQKSAFSEAMSGQGHSITYFDNAPANQDELLNRLKSANILVISNYPVSVNVVNSSPNLKMIAVAFTGVDHIPLELCKSRGIVVCNAAGYSTQAVAELTISFAISLLRRIVPFDKSTRNGGTLGGFLGSELAGKTFGIIGFGAIGERVALLAKAFGCKVVVWSRTKKSFEGADFVSLDELLKNSDIVSLHIPLNDKTRGLIDDHRLKQMKSSALLINTARGPIVNSEALSSALRSGVIAGAGIDVYEHEPPIEQNHPFFSSPNTILLPHIGFATQEAIHHRSEIVISNIKSWLAGKVENRV
jgi:phosphoglycerate dehydrogenase-like enzyme